MYTFIQATFWHKPMKHSLNAICTKLTPSLASEVMCFWRIYVALGNIYGTDDPTRDVVGRLLREDTGGNKVGQEIATRLALTEFLEM